MRVPAGVLAVLLLVQPATADDVAVPDAQAPPVLYLAGQEHAGTAKLAVITATGDRTQRLLDDVPLATYGLAVHAATGRWALTFGQLSNGDPLMIAGKAVSKPLDRNTLVLGDLDGVVGTTYGDPGCTSKKRVCFETPHRFAADGAYVFVEALTSSASVLSRWSFAKKPKRAALTDKKHGWMTISPDLKRASYVERDGGVHVVAWPAQKKKAAKVKLSKKALVDPDLLMSGPWPIGDRLYWFRREPVEQKRGYFEAFDLKTKQTVVLHEAVADFPMMNGEFLSTGPRGTVLFLDDVIGNFNRLDVFEASGDQSAVVAHDIRQLLDVSPDGRFLLATRWKDPKAGESATNPELLVIIDLQTKQELSALEVGVRIEDAAFVATMP